MHHTIAYRVFTFAFVITSFLGIKRVMPELSMSLQSGYLNALYINLSFFATLVIPIFLIWRNIESYRKKVPFIPIKLAQSKNKIFTSALVFIWPSVILVGLFILTFAVSFFSNYFHGVFKFSSGFFIWQLKEIGVPVTFAVELLTVIYTRKNA